MRIRCSSGIKQNVSILQVLRIRALGEFVLQRVAALEALADGRDGRLVDNGVGGHVWWALEGKCVGFKRRERVYAEC